MFVFGTVLHFMFVKIYKMPNFRPVAPSGKRIPPSGTGAPHLVLKAPAALVIARILIYNEGGAGMPRPPAADARSAVYVLYRHLLFV